MEKKMLFAPGPVLTSERVKNAALIPDICHRRSYFEKILQDLRQKILKLYNCSEEYVSAVISGSGTASNESVYSSLCSAEDKVLLITNGEFGNRLKEIIECYNIRYHELRYEWGEYPNLEEIENTIKNDREITIVGMVYHETSTGMLNPVKEVGSLCRKHNKLFFLDTISAVGGELLDLKDINVDLCTGVPNKCVSGHPGTAFVVLKRQLIERAEKIKPRNVYLNLIRHIKVAEEKNQTPNTPSVIMINVLLEAVNELLEEGLEERVKRYKKNAQIIRNGLKEMGLRLLMTETDKMSSTVTTVYLPQSIPMDDFLNEMENKGYVFYDGKGAFKSKNIFQIANMGSIAEKDCREMLEVLESVLVEKYGYRKK